MSDFDKDVYDYNNEQNGDGSSGENASSEDVSYGNYPEVNFGSSQEGGTDSFYHSGPRSASTDDFAGGASTDGAADSGRFSYEKYKNGEYGQAASDSQYEEPHYESFDDGSKRSGRKRDGGFSFRGIGKIVGAAVIFGVVAGACMVGVSAIKEKVSPSVASRIETTTASDSTESDSTDSSDSSSSSAITAVDVSQIVENVMPSVVSITSTVESTSVYGFGTEESEGAGSGFIIAKTDEKLMIATNNHVVSDATTLTVGFNDGTTAKAETVGTDSDADLAVISVNLSDITEDTASAIKVATLGSSDDLQVGETVIAIGNALGYGQSVTTGVISAKDREVSFTDGTMVLLQTDAAINPGNSGGVLINTSGEVIGINNAKLSDTSVEGMGYAIPISTANTILNDLMNAGTISSEDKAFLGIIGKTLDSTYSEALGMPSGIYVSQVISGSPAESAGISAGDIITEFEGNTVSSMTGLKDKISRKTADTKVEITLKRANQNGEYEEQTLTVTLGKASDFEDVISSETDDSQQSQDGSSDSNSGSSDGSNGYYYYYNNGNGSSGSSNPFSYYYNQY